MLHFGQVPGPNRGDWSSIAVNGASAFSVGTEGDHGGVADGDCALSLVELVLEKALATFVQRDVPY